MKMVYEGIYTTKYVFYLEQEDNVEMQIRTALLKYVIEYVT